MRKSCSRIAWGIGLSLFDFRIGGFDLLPDVLGFLLILIGLAGITARHREFAIAKAAAALLLLESIYALAFGQATTASLEWNGSREGSVGSLVYAAVLTLVNVMLVYGIAGGLGRMAFAGGKKQLAESLRFVWAAAYVIGAMLLFAFPFQLNSADDEMVMVLWAVVVVQIIVMLRLLLLVSRAGRQLGGRNGGGGGGGGHSGEGGNRRGGEDEGNDSLGRHIDVIA